MSKSLRRTLIRAICRRCPDKHISTARSRGIKSDIPIYIISRESALEIVDDHLSITRRECCDFIRYSDTRSWGDIWECECDVIVLSGETFDATLLCSTIRVEDAVFFESLRVKYLSNSIEITHRSGSCGSEIFESDTHFYTISTMQSI